MLFLYHRWQLVVILEKSGKDAFSKIKNHLTEFEKDKIQFLWKHAQGSGQFNQNWCKESFLTVYLKMLVIKIGNKKWNTAGTKKKLFKVVYMEVSQWNNTIFALFKDKHIWSEEVVSMQIVRITSSTLFFKSYFLQII